MYDIKVINRILCCNGKFTVHRSLFTAEAVDMQRFTVDGKESRKTVNQAGIARENNKRAASRQPFSTLSVWSTMTGWRPVADSKMHNIVVYHERHEHK